MTKLKNKTLINDLIKNKFQIDDGIINFEKFDILITDWSGIYIEFSKLRKNKSILIQNKEKILNKNIHEFKHEIIDTYARNKLGKILTLDKLENIEYEVDNILLNQNYYQKEIDTFFKKFFY